MLVGLAAALLAWIFVHLGSEVAQGDTRSFDMVVLSTMQVLRADHPWAAAVREDEMALLTRTCLMTFQMACPKPEIERERDARLLNGVHIKGIVLRTQTAVRNRASYSEWSAQLLSRRAVGHPAQIVPA